VLRGFDAAQADVGIDRRFRLTEPVGLHFRAEFFNVFNHPNFGNPNNSVGNPLFRLLDANPGVQFGLGRRLWRVQSALPDRRATLGPIGVAAAILSEDATGSVPVS